MHRLIAILALFATLAVVNIQYGHAQSDEELPALSGRVVDLANLLNSSFESRITAKLAAHEKATGEQVVVATIPSLAGGSIEDYSLRLARKWGIGQKDTDTGILFLVAKEDRKMRIEVGYGLEGKMTDAISSLIIRQTVAPLFRQGQFGLGIENGTNQILEVLAADGEARRAWETRANKKPSKFKPDTAWPLYIFLVIWLLIFVGGFVSSWLVKKFGREIKPGHYRWLGMDAGPNAPRPKRSNSSDGWTSGGWSGGGGGGWSSGGGGFSGGGGGFGGGGASGGW